jgi:hypothetical protein
LKLVILTEKYGDLGNRLFRFARLYASKPRGVALFDLSFCQYSHFYNPRRWSDRLIFRFLTLLRKPLLHHICSWAREAKCVYRLKRKIPDGAGGIMPTCEDVYREILEQPSRIVHLEGNAFHYRSSVCCAENRRARLENIFVLKSKYRRRAASLLKDRLPDSLLVAVHIRRNDYRVFDEGRHYYPDSVYFRSMLNLQETHSGARPIQFLLVSDESLEIENFAPLAPLYFGRQDPGTDQALLAASNAIVGPSSTFSAWPSYVHAIPRAQINSSAQSVNWNDFCVAGLN